MGDCVAVAMVDMVMIDMAMVDMVMIDMAMVDMAMVAMAMVAMAGQNLECKCGPQGGHDRLQCCFSVLLTMEVTVGVGRRLTFRLMLCCRSRSFLQI